MYEIQSPTAPTSISNTNAGVILPNGVFPVLHKILSGSQGQFKIDYSNRNLTFTLGSHTVISNLVDGRYPDWKRVASTVAKNTELFKVDPSAGAHTHTINTDGGTEARPHNIALLACIKY